MYSSLNNINTIELRSKIEEFKKLDLKNTSIEEISQKTLETLSSMIVTGCAFDDNSYLYRIRKLKKDLSDMPSVFQHIWYPTPELVKADGRVNLKGQPMLYCSTDQVTPIYECGISENDYYAMIQYSVKQGQNVRGYMVGYDDEPDGLNEVGKINNRIINDFLITEFGKPVKEGTEYLYKVSNVIATNFMDMPFCDAYVYPSVANNKKGWNVAIKPESADEKIKFDCVLICKFVGFTNEGKYEFQALHKANALDGDKLVYRF